MGLNVTESSAVNVLLRHLYGPSVIDPRRQRPSTAEVREASRVLAAASYKRLTAGYRPEDIPEVSP